VAFFSLAFLAQMTLLGGRCTPSVENILLASLSCTFPGAKTDFGRRAFSSAAPQIWNHILTAIKVLPSLVSFKRHLSDDPK